MGKSRVNETLIYVSKEMRDVKDKGNGVGFKKIPKITKGFFGNIIIIFDKVWDKVRIILVRDMFEDLSMYKNGYFKATMEIANAPFSLKKFEDLCLDFK